MRGCVQEPLQPSMCNLAISKRRKGQASCLNFSFPTLSVSVQQLINKQWILWTRRRMGLILCPPPALDTHFALFLSHKGNLTVQMVSQRSVWLQYVVEKRVCRFMRIERDLLLLLIHRRFGFKALAALRGVLVGSLSLDHYMNTSHTVGLWLRNILLGQQVCGLFQTERVCVRWGWDEGRNKGVNLSGTLSPSVGPMGIM